MTAKRISDKDRKRGYYLSEGGLRGVYDSLVPIILYLSRDADSA